MKILLIEPDVKLAGIYKKALEKDSHTVDWVHHAQDAVHRADAQKPELIILELQLSAHNGIEFLYEFRSYSEWQKIPVILLTMVTAESLQITPEILKRLKITACLYKPSVTLKKLLNTVNEQVV